MKTLLMLLAVFTGTLAQGAFAQPNMLLAWYPLNGTGDDTLGNFDPLILVNTPFQPGGGVYCNGRYKTGPGSDWSDVRLPGLPAALFRSFTFRATMKVEAPLEFCAEGHRALMIGGIWQRWLGVLVGSDTAFYLAYDQLDQRARGAHCTPGTWYDVSLSYDDEAHRASLSVNGVEQCSVSFTLGEVEEQDRVIGVTDYGVGCVFKGYLKDLRIYGDSSALAVEPETLRPLSQQLAQNYPNPFRESTAIDFTLPSPSAVSLSVHNMLGQHVATVVEDRYEAGKHTARWSPGALPPGVYIYRLIAAGKAEAKTLILRR